MQSHLRLSNMKKKYYIWFYLLIIIGFALVFLSRCKKEKNSEPITDIDGNVYDSVVIGTQTWMKENLRVSHYSNGDPIPRVEVDWQLQTMGAYCEYNNNQSYGETFGRLYNKFAVMDPRGLCPIGWHVSTYDEWILLTSYLGGDSIAGGKLKETGTLRWDDPNTGATDERGFKALPGGMCLDKFYNIRIIGAWWVYIDTPNQGRYVLYDDARVGAINYVSGTGMSVRCVRN
jgi:uncharacterized protein (TIGR02145 family)